MGRGLSEVRANLVKRYRDTERRVAHFSLPELVTDKIEKTIFAFLTEFGIDFPLDFNFPPPDREVLARQGTECLPPQGTYVAGSPTNLLDRVCITYKARDKGFLVIDSHDIIMEDQIADQWFRITHKFDEQDNRPNLQQSKGVAEGSGFHWKFNRTILVDGEVMEVCVYNDNPYAGGCYSLESKMWML